MSIDEIFEPLLEDIEPMGTYSGDFASLVAQAKQALYKDMLELLGEDERQPNPNVSEEYRARFYRVGGKNFVRQELRTKLRKYYGVEE